MGWKKSAPVLNSQQTNEALGLVRFDPERPGSWPDPPGSNRPGSKPGRIKNGRSVRYGPECKPVNPGLFPLSLARNGDGPSYVRNLSWRRRGTRLPTCDGAARGDDAGIARGHDGAARGDGDRFSSNVRALRRLLAGKASSSSMPPSLPSARVFVRVLASLCWQFFRNAGRWPRSGCVVRSWVVGIFFFLVVRW